MAQTVRPELRQVLLDQAAMIERANVRSVPGIDTQLVDDGTYFVVELDEQIAGCGGWSRRATLYGGDHSSGRQAHPFH
jgi:hypothetical protein